jgi:hypothetical protein
VSSPEPLHYYSLFSASLGMDAVLSRYSGNRFELETKYTSHVDITSRGVLPKVEMNPLASYLNELEDSLRAKAGQANPSHALIKWCSGRVTDSGPILHMEKMDARLTKAERYGNPFEREIHTSLIDGEKFEELVVSYYTFAYHCNGEIVKPKRDWQWDEIHKFNENINWDEWKKTLY